MVVPRYGPDDGLPMGGHFSCRLLEMCTHAKDQNHRGDSRHGFCRMFYCMECLWKGLETIGDYSRVPLQLYPAAFNWLFVSLIPVYVFAAGIHACFPTHPWRDVVIRVSSWFGTGLFCGAACTVWSASQQASLTTCTGLWTSFTVKRCVRSDETSFHTLVFLDISSRVLPSCTHGSVGEISVC